MGKHFFAGNNTSVGFYSYFDHILNPYEANKIYILKGGPGVGKSSFMKKLGRFFKTKDAAIEYIHCSTDANSLDGIHIPEYKLLVVDGTSPHVIEPKLPGLVDEILDFARFLDRDLLQEYREQIIKTNKEKTELYKSGYRYLEMAGIILNETSSIYMNGINLENKHNIEKELIGDLDKLISNYKLGGLSGRVRKMFADSYTPNGYVTYINKLCKEKEVWQIICPVYDYRANLLETIVSNLILKGFNVEGYYMPLFPDKLQHVYIKELGLMIATSNSQDTLKDVKVDKSYPLYKCLNEDILKAYETEIDINKELVNRLLDKGMNQFKEAKSKHEILEKIYIKSMKFDKVDLLYENIISNYEE